MIRAVRAEWTKLRSVRSTLWLSLGLVGGTVAAGAAVLATLNLSHCPATPPGCDEDTVRLSLAGAYLGQAAVVALAVLAVSTEYSTRMIRATLASCPRRLVVLAAKTTVVLATVLGAAVLGVLGSLAAGRTILPANGFVAATGYPPLSLFDGPTLRAAAGTVLYLGLIALLGLGLGAALRDTALSLIAVFGLLLALPAVAALITSELWRDRILRLSPTAGLAIQATKRLDALPVAPWQGLGVLAGYAGGALLLGAVLFRIRDP